MSDELVRDMSALYRAARRGDVQALEHLLQQNASILDNVPDDGCETPLHISALLNHASFTQVLLNRNGDLATRKDSAGRTALHLASGEDNLEAVQILLEFNDEPCLVADRKGRLPLHYAAMRGRTEVVETLVIARPNSLGCLDPQGNSVFHLCVTYNHFKTLQALVKLDYATANVTVGAPRAPIFVLPNHTGNTILHLAVMYMRDETVRYVLSIPEIREIRNQQNSEGLTAHDILTYVCPKDWKIDEIKTMLENDREGNCFMKIVKWMLCWMKYGDTTNFVEEVRGNLSAASIFITTVTFQALINPPGGFIQQGLLSQGNTTNSSSSDALNCTTLNDLHQYCPGQPVSSFHDQQIFRLYVECITTSFFVSICVTLLLVSGVPLQNSVVVWVLSFGMLSTLFFLALAYLAALDLMIPEHLSASELRIFTFEAEVKKLLLIDLYLPIDARLCCRQEKSNRSCRSCFYNYRSGELEEKFGDPSNFLRIHRLTREVDFFIPQLLAFAVPPALFLHCTGLKREVSTEHAKEIRRQDSMPRGADTFAPSVVPYVCNKISSEEDP
ncbi:ankyrin repeat-containing protein At2g01680-like [Neltuma alba]|uniref:ankyrin repeat-containing protein At2g01680-like n=1 Tax=Neltuma alba TaxID=207710 RepID=UPI0010A55CCD|nr:ankyrin repeat-containing protein At2g01680-like [Prosopis alba]